MGNKWQKVKIKDVGDCITGKTPSTKVLANFNSEDYMFIVPDDITGNPPLITKSRRYISSQGLQSIQTNTIQGKSVLVGCIGSDMGNVAYVDAICSTNQQINSITNFKTEYCAKFIYYQMKLMKNYLRTVAGSTTTPILPKSNFENLEIRVPNLSVQRAIARVLSQLDEKIELNKRINAELEKIAKTIYDYWFLQFDFPDENGKPYKSSGGKMVWNEELKREIPEGWKARKIVNILNEADKSKVQVNEAKEKGGYPFFTSGNSILSYDEFFVDGFNIFLNTGGNPDIKACMGKCAYSTDTWCISANEYSYVLYYYLLKLMPQFEQLFFAGSGLKHLQKKALKNKYILLPDIRVLKIFNDSCVSSWRKIANCLIQNKELSSLRDFLLPLLMNGQVAFKLETE